MSPPTRARPTASSLISMQRTIRCTVTRKEDFSTATIAATATFHCTSSMGDTCSLPSSGKRTSTLRLARKKKLRASWRMRANQLRLWFSSLAYVLVEAVRRLGLARTEMANATAGSIRLKLLKIGAVVTVSVRRIKLAFASACPTKDVFIHALQRLRELRAPPETAAAA